jgi:plasmid replication initiation protein
MKSEMLEIDYIKEWLKLPKSYDVYGNLKKKILDKVSDDLKKHSDIYMTFEPKKDKRKVTHIIFTYTKNLNNVERQNSFFNDEELSTEYDKYIGVKYKNKDGDLVEIRQILEVLKDVNYIKVIVFNEFAQANQEAKILKSSLLKMK